MIYKEMAGRLGNQLFQFATLYAFMKENGIDEPINTSFEKVKKTQKNFYDSANTLKDYKIENMNVVTKVQSNILQKIIVFIVRVIEFFMRKIIRNFDKYEKNVQKFEVNIQPFLNHFSIYNMTFGYTKLKKGIFKNYIFRGNFESAKYFEKYKEDIQRMYVPKNKALKENKNMIDAINSSESVCVTIRRGDFLNDRNKKKFYACDEKYFSDSIKLMNEKLKNPKYFVFSDDIKWCKENMVFPKGSYFESGNDPVWEKLRIMSSCKHFIISNSTFSWWCEFLSKSKNKVVIAPKYWRNFGYYKDIYEDYWLLIDNKRND